MTETAEETVAHVRATICANPADTSITVDGVEVTKRIASVQISQRSRELPTVILELVTRPGQDPIAELDGLAKVYVGVPEDPGPAAAAFLSSIDPEELEKAALNRPDLENVPAGGTAAILRQLAEWASGRP